MEKDLDLIIVYPPSEKSKEFLNYCKKTSIECHNVISYAIFASNLLQNYYQITKENGLCCFICYKDLCRDFSLAYSHILTNLHNKKHAWNFLDEIILVHKGTNYGKIAVLKKGNMLETMSRGERLFYVSIPQEEKDEIFHSMWSIPKVLKHEIHDKIIRWIVLSYSNVGEKVLFTGRTKISSRIISKLKRVVTQDPIRSML